MTKTHPERPSDAEPAAAAAALSPNVRRHLGQTLRTHYADTLAAPVSQRLEALIAQLGKAKL
ncbi:hypothetical protein [Methylobacterium sp. NEAU K]|uniref:hypothetical protein n=1 Tax=Methylobacterium sp. NEAU K TaxID=3064946 RepID=UPI0027328026|nr:hypothetical protein [Methylobacterium sp. NEAU K]MDP4005760.1 hypothetical protein [Methylobacterium sp. NEAU K]